MSGFLGVLSNFRQISFWSEHSFYEKRRRRRRKKNGGKNKKIMLFIVATKVVANQPPECQPTGTPTAHAKSGNLGPKWAKPGQTGPNRAQPDQNRPNRAKPGQTSLNWAKRSQNGWFFLHEIIFLWDKNRPSYAFLLIPRSSSDSTRSSVTILVLVRGNF